jgi:hypothetical protein
MEQVGEQGQSLSASFAVELAVHVRVVDRSLGEDEPLAWLRQTVRRRRFAPSEAKSASRSAR